MNAEQALIDLIRVLPGERQEEVLAYAEGLRDKSDEPKVPRPSGRGLWADLKIDLTAEDIDEVRREMWKNFPRDDF